MKTINVREATNTQLDWLVAKCSDKTVVVCYRRVWLDWIATYGHTSPNGTDSTEFLPTTNWSQMGPIIERGPISTKYWDAAWTASMLYEDTNTGETLWVEAHGETHLVAAARCYVMSKMGETAEVPEELT